MTCVVAPQRSTRSLDLQRRCGDSCYYTLLGTENTHLLWNKNIFTKYVTLLGKSEKKLYTTTMFFCPDLQNYLPTCNTVHTLSRIEYTCYSEIRIPWRRADARSWKPCGGSPRENTLKQYHTKSRSIGAWELAKMRSDSRTPKPRR